MQGCCKGGGQMIDKEVKRKIMQKEEISSAELIQYFNQMPAPIEKGLFKKIRQKRKVQTHEDTKLFLLDNFSVVLDKISHREFSAFLRRFGSFSHQKELFEKLSENNKRIAELLKESAMLGDLEVTFASLLRSEYDAHVFFENNFGDLYTNTNAQQFDIKDFFIIHPLSDEIKPLLLSRLCEVANEQKLRKEDIPLFLREFIRNETANDHVFWNYINTPDSPIPEKTKYVSTL